MKIHARLSLLTFFIVSNFYVLGQCPTVTETITAESCAGACDGQIQIDITAGTGPYTVEWFDGGGVSLGVTAGVVATTTLTGLCAGNYSVDVSSAGGGGSTSIFTEDFNSGINGWTLNVSTGANGADNNYFEIDDDESGMPAGTCGAAGMGNPSLHVTSVFFPNGGAAYDAGGLCGILFCPLANRRTESPNISTVGFTGLTLTFDYIGNGDGMSDNASLWYNDGGGWTLLDPSLKSNMCGVQGEWTAYSVALPASCENIANLQIGFNWTNNDDGVGTDPSFAVNDVEIVSATGGGGCTTNEAYVVGTGGPCACPITITETLTDESCPTACDGEIQIDIAAGTGPYTVEWFDAGGASLGVIPNVVATETITGLCPGDYSVEVTEAGSSGGGSTSIFTEDFNSGINGWTLNVSTGANGADNNYFEIDDDESGMPAGTCGAAGMGNPSLHVTSVFFPNGGAAYDAGGLCGILFCPLANRRTESPNISTVGFTGLTLTFDYIGNGDGMNDNASLWYNDGGGWTLLDPSLKSNMCGVQGEWTAYSVALPASCENIANLQIGFNWTNNDDGVGTDPSFAVNDIEIVSATSGGGPGCTQTESYTLAPGVNPVITTETSTDITTCAAPDGSITITANGTSYELFTSAGVSVSTNATGSFTNLVAGDYYVEVSLSGCIVQSSVFTISNASAPAAPTANADATYCVGDVMSDMTVFGTGGTFNWFSDAGLTTNIGTGGTLAPGATLGATTYYVTETVAGCESAASTVVITINVCCDLDVVSAVTNETCSGLNNGSIDFTVTGSGTYDILIGGTVEFNDITAGVHNFNNQADGLYAVQVVDITDPTCDTTFNVTINAGTVVSINSENSTDITDCLSPDGTFTVTSNGTSFELFNSSGGSIATNATGVFTGLNAGDYYVVASLGACTGQSSTLTISNASAPAAPAAGINASYCQGDAMLNLNAIAGSGGTLNWFSNAGLTNNIGTGSTIAPGTTLGATIYYVTETLAGCQSAASSVTITINSIPAAPVAGTNATYCLGDVLANLTATASVGGTLNWFSDAGLLTNIGTGTTLTPSATLGATTYYVTETAGVCESVASTVVITINSSPIITSELATDLTSCIAPDGSITIASNGTSFELFTAAGVSVSINATGVFNGLAAGTYYVVATSGTCSTQGANLVVNDVTSTSSNTVNNTVCQGASYTYADGTTSTNIIANESHTSTLTNVVGCDSIIIENISFIPSITNVVDVDVCSGTDYTFADGTNHVNMLLDQTYTSILNANNGCDSIVIENVTILPPASIDLGFDRNICFGESVTITATTNAGNPLWSTGETTMSITFIASADMTYFASVTGACGSDSDTINITVLPPPVVDAGLDQTIPLGAQADLLVTGIGVGMTYVWEPASFLSCSFCENPIASPTATTAFIVTGTDENGCSNLDTVYIIIDGEIGIYIPNVFSPNGDGQNDLFRVYGPAWTTYKMEIYNRWGGLVWESENPNVEWSGLNKKGEECPQAVFIYKFTGVSIIGMAFEKSSNVLLTR